jgi:hypothetical protein
VLYGSVSDEWHKTAIAMSLYPPRGLAASQYEPRICINFVNAKSVPRTETVTCITNGINAIIIVRGASSDTDVGDWTHLVTFEVFTAVTMKNGVFWDVTPCGSCKNRRSRET